MLKKDIENFLKALHSMNDDELENLDKDEMTKFLVVASEIRNMIEVAEKRAKTSLKESGYNETIYYPDFQKKVILSEGRSYDVIAPLAVFNGLKAINKEDEFIKIISVQKKLVEELNDSSVSKVVKDNTMTDKGDSYISVARMNKEELVEHFS